MDVNRTNYIQRAQDSSANTIARQLTIKCGFFYKLDQGPLLGHRGETEKVDFVIIIYLQLAIASV